jgi:molybdenum cofactor cytidylyltransferase
VKFGEIPIEDAAGAVLAHSLRFGSLSLRKGRLLTAENVAALKAAGCASVVAARLEPGDVEENAAAAALAPALTGRFVKVGPAFTGRVNFLAEVSGLFVVDRDRIDRFNLVDETITLGTLEPFSVVAPKQIVATLKVIPFAVSPASIAARRAAAEGAPLLTVAAFAAKRVVLIQTRLPGLKESILDKTVETTRGRLAALGSALVAERRCDHRAAELASLIGEVIREQADLVLVAGASAILDRRDVIPAAIEQAGGAIEHFGMPVDPGNLMLMGRLGAVAVLGLPGCARSPKSNGFDWVLRRLLADLPAGPAEIMRMGVGGLLTDIPSRPLPRAQAAAEADAAPRASRIAAIVLAAGQSRRMGTLNKLTIDIDGKTMLRRVVEAVTASSAKPVIVVTGHEREHVEAALAGLPVETVFNPDYAEGLSTSLKCGLTSLPATADGAIICLGDMPLVSARDLDQLVAAFNPVEGRAIVVPTRRGKRGNPVVIGKAFFTELAGIGGDIGARDVIAAHPEQVAEVEMEGDGVLTDIDTPQALAKLARAAKMSA